jgi:tetratricopeptide (TPR) repeat protein
MSQPSDYELPPPREWKLFERWVRDIFSAEWGNQAKMNGRSGQSQFGVDIYGQPKDSNEWHGVQCKKRSNQFGSNITCEEIKNLVKMAKYFKPFLTRYIIATTSPRDASIQADVREISDKNKKEGSFEVDIIFWDDFLDMYDRHENVCRNHFKMFYRGQEMKPEKSATDEERNIKQIAKKILTICGILHYGGLECRLKEIAKLIGIDQGNKYEFSQYNKGISRLKAIGLIETHIDKLIIPDLQSNQAVLSSNPKEKLIAIQFALRKIRNTIDLSMKLGFWVNWRCYEEAFEKLEQGFSSPDINDIIDIWSYKWYIYDLRGANLEAEKAAKEALKHVNQGITFKYFKKCDALLKYQLAISLQKQKKFSDAEKYYIDLLKAPRNLPFPAYIKCLVYYGHILRKKEDFEKSFLTYENALTNVEKAIKQEKNGDDGFKILESLLVEPLLALVFLFYQQKKKMKAKKYGNQLKGLKTVDTSKGIYLDNNCLPPTLMLPVRVIQNKSWYFNMPFTQNDLYCILKEILA